jgi:anti-sigma B factor antagonist
VFTLDVDHRADHLLLRLGGELDLESSRAFRDQLTHLLREAQGPTLLDLSGLAFIDSSGLGALVAVLRMPEEERPRFVLTPANGPVNRVLRNTRLEAHLGIFPSIEAALTAAPIRSAA